MSTNERDTHFQKFAKLLFQEMLDACNGHIDIRYNEALARWQFEEHIAQRAYDLVFFLLDKAPHHAGSFDTGYGTPEEIHETIAHLPDLDAWPPTTAE